MNHIHIINFKYFFMYFFLLIFLYIINKKENNIINFFKNINVNSSLMIELKPLFLNFLDELKFLFLDFLIIIKNPVKLIYFLFFIYIFSIILPFSILIMILSFFTFFFLTILLHFLKISCTINLKEITLKKLFFKLNIIFNIFIYSFILKGYIFFYFFLSIFNNKNFKKESINYSILLFIFFCFLFRLEFLIYFGISYYCFYMSVWFTKIIFSKKFKQYNSFFAYLDSIFLNLYMFFLKDVINMVNEIKIIFKNNLIICNPLEQEKIISIMEKLNFNVLNNITKYSRGLDYEFLKAQNSLVSHGHLSSCLSVNNDIYFLSATHKQTIIGLMISQQKEIIRIQNQKVSEKDYFDNEQQQFIFGLGVYKFGEFEKTQIPSKYSEKPITSFKNDAIKIIVNNFNKLVCTWTPEERAFILENNSKSLSEIIDNKPNFGNRDQEQLCYFIKELIYNKNELSKKDVPIEDINKIINSYFDNQHLNKVAESKKILNFFIKKNSNEE